MDPKQFAQLIGAASDEQIEQGLTANRDMILGEIFRRMPEQVHAERARNVDAVVQWEITGRPDGGSDRFQLTIKGGTCELDRDGSREPTVSYVIGPVDFVKLVSGNASGPQLFVFGKLKIRGDLMLAARMPSLFKIPRAAA
jgi:putative sterol carrier protein